MLDIDSQLEVPAIYFKHLGVGDTLYAVNKVLHTVRPEADALFYNIRIRNMEGINGLLCINRTMSSNKASYFAIVEEDQTVCYTNKFYVIFSNREAALNYAAEEIKKVVARNNQQIIHLQERSNYLLDRFKLSKI
jgi:hypothetical protein